MRYLLSLLLLCSGIAAADNAASCISLGRTEKGQSLRNTCNLKVIVFWCHQADTPEDRRGHCGFDGKFYRKAVTLEPGQVEANPYGLPAAGDISFGACFGGYWDYTATDNEGGYSCRLTQAVATASAADPDAACQAAKAQVRNASGQCDCQSTEQRTVCKASGLMVAPGPSLMGTAREIARPHVEELEKCSDQNGPCTKRKNAGPGIRD
ncbi:MAG TPA: hypothetical protein VFM34_08890 [Moraxellaceae bacterium]|nr:hypothetical protein [Moraxellaceae bacterium]